MIQQRIKNNGYHDILVQDDQEDREVVFIRQHGLLDRATLVISRAALPNLISALTAIYNP